MTAELYAFECGWITAPAAGVLSGATGEMRIPIPAYLIRHPKGLAMFDTGLSATLIDDVEGDLGSASAARLKIEMTAASTIQARMAAAGFDIDKVDLVINSHMHFDHTGGNCACCNADVLVQQAEFDYAESGQGGTTYKAEDWETGQTIRKVTGEYDVFGDGSVVCFPSTGHTPGHQSLRLRTDRGEGILCGDACYFRRTLDEMRLPAHVFDEAAFRASLQTFADFRAGGARLFFGHCPETWGDVPQGPARVL